MNKVDVFNHLVGVMSDSLGCRYRVAAAGVRNRSGYPVYIYYDMLTLDGRVGGTIGVELRLTLKRASELSDDSIRELSSLASKEIKEYVSGGISCRVMVCDCDEKYIEFSDGDITSCADVCSNVRYEDVMAY